MQTKIEKVSFRLAPEFAKLLEQQAVQEGRSAGDCARRILIRALTDTERAEFRTEIMTELEKLLKGFKKMRGDFATLSLALLVKVARENPDVAVAWIRENLGPEEPDQKR